MSSFDRAHRISTRGRRQSVTFQPRDNISECRTNNRATSVLSYDQRSISSSVTEENENHCRLTYLRHRCTHVELPFAAGIINKIFIPAFAVKRTR